MLLYKMPIVKMVRNPFCPPLCHSLLLYYRSKLTTLRSNMSSVCTVDPYADALNLHAFHTSCRKTSHSFFLAVKNCSLYHSQTSLLNTVLQNIILSFLSKDNVDLCLHCLIPTEISVDERFILRQFKYFAWSLNLFIL